MSRTHGRTLLERLCRGLLVVVLLLCLSPASAGAQTYDELTRLGNDAYNAGKFSEAVSSYVRAIQTAPASAERAYLNLARAYNQLKQYNHAQAYYTWYLELVPDDRKAAEELKRVEKQTKTKTAAPITTETQNTALKQLEQAISDGVFLADGGSGALAIYDVLLRTGYAAPALLPLQTALAEGLVAEADRLATPGPMQAAPTLDRSGWATLRTRLERAAGFVDVPVGTPRVHALFATANGWQEYLKGDYADAATQFERAIQHDPAVLAAQWGRALALSYSDTSADLAPTFAAIDAAQAAFAAAGRAPEPYFPILRARALQAIGRADEAAALLLAL